MPILDWWHGRVKMWDPECSVQNMHHGISRNFVFHLVFSQILVDAWILIDANCWQLWPKQWCDYYIRRLIPPKWAHRWTYNESCCQSNSDLNWFPIDPKHHHWFACKIKRCQIVRSRKNILPDLPINEPIPFWFMRWITVAKSSSFFNHFYVLQGALCGAFFNFL